MEKIIWKKKVAEQYATAVPDMVVTNDGYVSVGINGTDDDGQYTRELHIKN